MRPAPTLLALTLDAALLRIATLRDLSRLPDHILVDLFRVRAPSSPPPRIPNPSVNRSPLITHHCVCVWLTPVLLWG